MKCGDCKHWGLEKEAGMKFRSCTAVVHDKDDATGEEDYSVPVEERDYYKPERRQKLILLRESARAVVKDASGYFAALKCRESFGCVLFEEKK